MKKIIVKIVNWHWHKFLLFNLIFIYASFFRIVSIKLRLKIEHLGYVS